jgi:lipopolysaccharide transport system permease protein
MAVLITSLGLVFGAIFKTPMQIFLPYLASGIILWALISGILNDGAQAFISAEAMIRQLPIPKLALLVRVIWRNLLNTAHNIVIFPIVLLAVGSKFGWALIVWPLGLIVTTISVSGLALNLAIISTRYRDVPPMIQASITVAFYVTPIIWRVENLGNNELAHLLLGLNPFYHLLQISRLPLIGQWPTLTNWGLAALSAGVFWTLGIIMFRKFEHRIAYWV